jgi:signal transduction histidine kinase
VRILFAAKLCRIACLVISVFIIRSFNESGGQLTQYYKWFLAYLSASTVLLFVINKDYLLCFLLLFNDYIVILLFQYFSPHNFYLELVWLPELIVLASVIFPPPVNYLYAFLMGVPGYLAFNYLNYENVHVMIGGTEYSGLGMSLVFCLPVTLLALVIGFLYGHFNNNSVRIDSLECLNRQINKMNREIMNKVFVLQNIISLEERKQVSKEIHDVAGYVFVNLIMMLQAAQAVFGRDQQKSESLIAQARDYAEQGINEIRYLLRDVRNYRPEFISLQNSLFDVADSFTKATGVDVTINYGNWPASFGKELDSFFTSLMQESLTNALKHGRSSSVSVQCWLSETEIIMSVNDNGSGSEIPVKKGIGLSSVEGFVIALGGKLNVQSVSGFQIAVFIPKASIQEKSI